MKTFQGKVAAITGAGSGIGRALAFALADRGAKLALSDIDEAKVTEVATLLASKTTVTAEKVDVANRDAVFAWAANVVKAHRYCNLIINNAGVALGATAEGTPIEDFEWLMGINFWGVIHGTQAFMPLLRASGDGHVVNLSSCFGLAGIPGQSAYNASKFAVRGYTESLRQELELTKAQVSATCVHPGGIKTNILRAARLDRSMAALGLHDPEAERGSLESMFRTSADEAAKQILRGVETNARRVLIGNDARALDALVRLAPTGYQKIVSQLSLRLRKKR